MIGKMMKLFAFSFILLSMAGCIVYSEPTHTTPLPPPARSPRVDTSIFYDDLAPYGDWFWLDNHGWCWSPYGVPVGWEPYTDGHWVFTDFGLTWVSDWDWGWAPFHVGRWMYAPYYGWVWIPGTEWAPAWVVWRYGPGWCGWAPMPPQAHWRPGIGIDFGGIDIDIIIQPYWWRFVEENYLLHPQVHERFLPPARNVTIIKTTRHVTNYTILENHVINNSISIQQLEKGTGRPVSRYRIVDADSPVVARSAVLKGNELHFFKPALKQAPPDSKPSQAAHPRPGTPPHEGDIPQKPGKIETQVPVQEKQLQPGADIIKRHEIERQQMEQQHAARRAELEKIHQKEMTRHPSNVSIDELKQRQAAERRALEEQATLEKQLLQKRQERDKQMNAPSNKPDEGKKGSKGRR